MGIEEVKKLLMDKFNLGTDFDFSSIIKMIEGALGKPISQVADPSAIMGAISSSGGIEGLGAMLEGDGKPGLSLGDIANADTLKKVGSLLGGNRE